MRFIQLERGEKYGPIKGLTFLNGVPIAVEDEELIRRLILTGRFRSVDAADVPAEDTLGIPGIVPRKGTPKLPVNGLGADDLNDKRVLLCRHGAIGDTVFVIQFAAYLKRKFPRVKMIFGVRANLVDFAKMFTCFDKVCPIQDTSTSSFIGTVDYAVHFNGVIEMRSNDDTDYFKLHWERAAITGSTFEDAVPLLPTLALRDEAKGPFDNLGRELLRSLGIEDQPFIVVLPSASTPMKALGIPQLTALCQKLSEFGGTKTHVVCIGGVDDQLEMRKIQQTGWIHTAVGQDVSTSACLVKRAGLVIGGDTGMMHMARAFGVPTISYWGPTDCELTKTLIPAGTRAEFVTSKSSCAPCRVPRPSKCEHWDGSSPACMKQTVVDEIVEHASKILFKPIDSANGSAGATHERIVIEEEVALQASLTMTPEEVAQSFDPTRMNVAVALDYADRFTGGGLHAWSLAAQISKRPLTTVYMICDVDKPVYLEGTKANANFVFVPDMTFSLVGDTSPVEFDLVIGTPHKTGVLAVTYAERVTACKSVCLIYETPNYVRKYRVGADTEERYWNEYKDAMLRADHIWPISKETKRHLLDWDERFKERAVRIVYPAINNAIARENLPAETPARCRVGNKAGDSAVMISRHVRYKGLRDCMEAICNDFAQMSAMFSEDRPFTLYIIGDDVRKLIRFIHSDWKWRGIHVRLLENCPEATKWQLIREAKALVHPSDFEGFGIPLAEAMYAGTPVVAHPLTVFQECFGDKPFYYTSNTGLVKTLHTLWEAYESPVDEPTQSALMLEGHLEEAVQFVSVRYTRNEQGGNLGQFFDAVFNGITKVEQAEVLEISKPVDGPMRVAFVTPWGNRCGIAEVTRVIANALTCTWRVFAPVAPATEMVYPDDPANVIRCWDHKFKLWEKLFSTVMEWKPSVVHFQHEFSLFKDTQQFLNCARRFVEAGVSVACTTHTVGESKFIADLSHITDAVVVTKEVKEIEDLRPRVIPLPVRQLAEPLDKAACRDALGIPLDAYVVGTFGFWNPHKGFREFAWTYNDVALRTGTNTQYIIAGHVPPKFGYFTDTKLGVLKRFEKGKIRLFDKFLPYEEVLRILAVCDVLVYYYNVNTHSSSSAAIREGLGLGLPIICSDCRMFSELVHEENVYKVPYEPCQGVGVGPQPLIDALIRLHDDGAMRTQLSKGAIRFATDNSLKRVANQHIALYGDLHHLKRIGV